jgi:RNA polymerase sigma-70 factor (ECF subfamily)
VDELTRLALAAGDGDLVARAAFVRRTQPEVWRLLAHLAERSVADDLTQEVYLRALPALVRFRAEASARTWLLSIARRVAADHVRHQRRRRALALRQPGVTEPDPAASVELSLLLDRLDHDRRVAFVLTQLLGLTYAETASVCGCPVGTVRSRVARARDQLIEAMHRDQPGRRAL